jgi:hypothetical protein
MCYRPGRTHIANDAFPHGSAGLELCREISVEGAARREKNRAGRRVEEKGRDRGKRKALESREGEEREEQASVFLGFLFVFSHGLLCDSACKT